METISLYAQERLSPDKHWEYQYSNGVGPQIVKANTSEAVLDLSDVLPSEKNGLTANRAAEPVWAPDSKRVVFNYVVHEHRADGFGTIVLFELRNDNGCSYGPLWTRRTFSRLGRLAPGMTIAINLQNWPNNIYERTLISPLFYDRRVLAIFSESSNGLTLILLSSGLFQAMQA